MPQLLGIRQVVRHWFLVPAFAGSNPASPATLRPRCKPGFLCGIGRRTVRRSRGSYRIERADACIDKRCPCKLSASCIPSHYQPRLFNLVKPSVALEFITILDKQHFDISIRRWYYNIMSQEIPDPAYWAITKRNGAQLITPDSPFYETIVENIERAETHGVIGTGDILVASKSSFVIDPTSIGIERRAISDYKSPDQVVQGALRTVFKR
jgi:hypothetical protein